MYHRSVITPEGLLYLTGGIEIDKNNKTTSACYTLNYDNNSLDLIKCKISFTFYNNN